jgi:hypothetical protein
MEAVSAEDGWILSKGAKVGSLFQRACPALGVHKTIPWGDLTGIRWPSGPVVRRMVCRAANASRGKPDLS